MGGLDDGEAGEGGDREGGGDDVGKAEGDIIQAGRGMEPRRKEKMGGGGIK